MIIPESYTAVRCPDKVLLISCPGSCQTCGTIVCGTFYGLLLQTIYMSRSIILSIGALLLMSVQAMAQTKDASENKRFLEEKNFVFIAQQVNPQRGGVRQLTSQYDLTITPDTVSAFLPYFGRAYTAPINPTDGGIKFSSTDFNYQSVAKKKGRYEITITPKDAAGVANIRITAFENGRATVQVVQLNKDPISFTGYFTGGPDRPKKAF
ncbi:MAG: DUF4251 domain-containing protein [Chitinophagaceae bacterium]|nr:MAG: DUF4251 domain-containing protein [Chitinophagaceae bacterium]